MEYVIAFLLLLVLWGIRDITFILHKNDEEKEMRDICEYINDNKDVFVRTKDCKKVKFHAHVARYSDTNNECIVIDID